MTGDVRLHGGEYGSYLWQPSGVFSTSDIYNGYKVPNGTQGGATSVGPLLRFNNGGQNAAHNNVQPTVAALLVIKT